MWKVFLFLIYIVWPVVATPTVEMDDVTVLWTNESVQFVCRVRSELEPQIVMGFISCAERTLNFANCSTADISSVDVKVEHMDDAFGYKAYGKIAPPEFGVVLCFVKNSQGTSFTSAKLYPVHSHKQLDLEIISPKGTVHKGDTAVFRCRANAYNFTNRFMLIQDEYVLNGTGHIYKYAWEVDFIIEMLSAKNVTCGAYHKKGGFQNVTLDLEKEFLFNPINIVDTKSVHFAYAIFGGCLAVVAIVGLVVFYWNRSKRHANAVEEVDMDEQDGAIDDDEEEESSQPCDLVLTIPPIYSFPKDKLLFGRKIGEGEYGIVRMAQAKDIMVHEPFTTVAVKQTKSCGSPSLLQGMISEIKMMILVGQHLNIVNFLGAVTENIQNNELMIIFEYCRYGSVLSFMQSKRSTFVNCIDDLPMAWITSIMNPERDSDDESQMILRTTDLVCWATQIAFGMEYLSSKNIFHGDLAARNVLLCEKGVVKIADFGLAREFNRVTHYKKTSNDRVPFKWMALESIFEHKFSIKTDVWSYGVLLWELFTLGMPPYATLAVNDEFFQKLRDGYRLERPKYTNEDIYYTMLSCWCVNPECRPTFHTLGQFFNLMLPPALQNHYLALNDQYLQMMTRKVKSQ